MSYDSVLKDAETRMEKAVSHSRDMLKNIRTSPEPGGADQRA